MKKLVVFFVFALVLAAGVFSSCSKDNKVVLYNFYLDVTDRTAPTQIENPEMREIYTNLLTDLLEDLGSLNMNGVHEAIIVNNQYDAEDKIHADRYDSVLPAVKALEAQYRQRIEDLGEPKGLAFFIQVAFTLSRSTPAEASSLVKMREYAFDLRCGYGGYSTL